MLKKNNISKYIVNKYEEVKILINSMNSKFNKNILDLKKPYRVLVLGGIGVGKSQFCNFIRRDLNNSINKISETLDPCTNNFNFNAFTRNKIDFEFIDTPGFPEDSSENDFLKKLINF